MSEQTIEHGHIGDGPRRITRKLRERIAALEADNAALRGLLREFAERSDDCIICGDWMSAHAADCRLDAALEDTDD